MQAVGQISELIITVDSEEGGMFDRKVGTYLLDYMVSQTGGP
jgi:hypothetical protein